MRIHNPNPEFTSFGAKKLTPYQPHTLEVLHKLVRASDILDAGQAALSRTVWVEPSVSSTIEAVEPSVTSGE